MEEWSFQRIKIRFLIRILIRIIRRIIFVCNFALNPPYSENIFVMATDWDFGIIIAYQPF
jgi:hypothetical protein